MTNPLVAGPVEMSTPFTGAFLLESGEALCAAIESGDWVAGGMASFSAVLDAVSLAIDPIGSLIAMGLGWVVEHLEPIRSWFNDLTGDAGEVAGFAATWTNIAAHLTATGEQLAASASRLDGLTGQTIDAYRALHGDAAAHVAASGQWAQGIAAGMQIASMIVKMVHDLARDALSTIVGTAVSATITTAATVGFGAPVAVAQVASKVASLSARVATFVTRLLTSMKNLIKLVGELIDLFRRFLRSFDEAVPNGKPGSGGGASPVGGAPAPVRPPTFPVRQPVVGSTDGGPGHWISIKRNDGADYQEFASGAQRYPDGRSPEYRVGDTNFDGYVRDPGPPPADIYLDAKDGYRAVLPESGKPFMTELFTDKWVEEATAQLKAIRNTETPGSPPPRLEWHFSDPDVAEFAQDFFENIANLPINVVHVPKA